MINKQEMIWYSHIKTGLIGHFAKRAMCFNCQLIVFSLKAEKIDAFKIPLSCQEQYKTMCKSTINMMFGEKKHSTEAMPFLITPLTDTLCVFGIGKLV